MLHPVISDTFINPADFGLYYLNSRFYDSKLGRFISADTVEVISATAGSLTEKNLYAYCNNNPVIYRDSTGAFAETVFDIVSLGFSIAEVAANPTDVWAWAGLAGDAIDLISVITGAGEVIRGLKAVSKTVDVVDDAVDTARIANRADNVSDAITGACFVAGTLILTSRGYVPIEDICAGDKVWSQNSVTGEKNAKEVVQTFMRETKELVHVHVNREEIVTTPEHPFYVATKGWISAVQLRAGDILVLQSGKYVIVEMIRHEILESPVTVYNFEVEDFHTYYVGNSAVLVHNDCIIKENGVKIESYYPLDHGNPTHLHVNGGGAPTKIGPQGLPVKGYPALTPKQATVVANNLPIIKKTIKQKQKILRSMKVR